MIKKKAYLRIAFFCILSTSSLPALSATNNTSNNSTTGSTVPVNYEFYEVPSSQKGKVFNNAITKHIVSNRGIQDFYTIPNGEINWLNTITQIEKDWHKKLQALEHDYRSAFRKRSDRKTGQNDKTILIQNYSNAIQKLEGVIDSIRRQIVQINMDQQVYINSLRTTPNTALVAIKTLFTADLMNNRNKLDVLNSTLFQHIEEPVLSHITKTYNNQVDIPFQGGRLRVTYMYPENITLFDARANEHVYLFLRVEAYPFSASVTKAGGLDRRTVGINILTESNQVQDYLKQENVGDKRLLDWLNKELEYQKVQNEHTLGSIRAKLEDFAMFRDGLKKSIDEISGQVKILEKKKNLLNKGNEAETIESNFQKAKKGYQQHYSTRVVLSHEKYTLEHDVMFSRLMIEGENGAKKDSKSSQMLDARIATTIPISGRPLKDIFTDILQSANKKQTLDLKNYRERIYRSNDEQTQLIQGELEWKIIKEEFSILKLTRGNVGSRNHFVVHLAKRTHLKSKPSFPIPRAGVCNYTIFFDRGKSNLRKSSQKDMNRLTKCLRQFPRQRIQIIGHTDPLKPDYGEGTKFSNVKLGLNRAETIMDALIAQGFNPGRFVVISQGAKNPVAIGKEKTALEKNRRVDVISNPKL